MSKQATNASAGTTISIRNQIPTSAVTKATMTPKTKGRKPIPWSPEHVVVADPGPSVKQDGEGPTTRPTIRTKQSQSRSTVGNVGQWYDELGRQAQVWS
jgi:hypothetical protein